jgi:hypothetical protein
LLSSTFFQLPSYWHEYLDLVYLFKCIYENSDKNVKLNSPNRVTRRSSSISGLFLQIIKSKTVTFQNSFYIRACRTWNTLPISLKCYCSEFYILYGASTYCSGIFVYFTCLWRR